MTERVVITGLGVISCLGNDAGEVKDALFNGRSGISVRQDHIDAGMRSHIAGTPQIDLAEHIDRKQWRFMGDAAGYAYLSLQQAIAHAGLTPEQVSNPRTGIVAGSGGASAANQVEAAIFSETGASAALGLTGSHRRWAAPSLRVWPHRSRLKVSTTPCRRLAQPVRTVSVTPWS